MGAEMGSRALRLSVLLLLSALCVQILASVCTTSPTFDEPYHIARSYAYLRSGDSALLATGGHPPLANLLSVMPLMLRSDIALPPHQPGWPEVGSFKDLFGVADEFLWRIGNDAQSIILWARLPVMLLSVLLALLVFVWAKQLHGALAGLLALLLYAFDPNILAHSGVVTTDLGATFFIFAGVYCLHWFCQRPSWNRLVLSGIVFGLAQASKFSALFLMPIVFVLLAIWARDAAGPGLPLALPGHSRFSGRPWLQRMYTVIALCLIIFVVGFFALWAVYRFEARPLLPHEETHPVLDRLLPLGNPSIKRATYALAESVPLPAPAYFAGLEWLRRYARAGHPAFLMGTYGVQGWWFYFPVGFLIKSPIPLLVLLLAASYSSLRHRENLRQESFLVVPMVLFFVFSMFSSIDIGYRNILPVLPFAFVWVSKVVPSTIARPARAALLLLCAWYVMGTVTLSPHYLAYFNEFAGGPSNGYKYLVDSNLDWGQDLQNLKKYLDAQGIDEIYLSYFGTADPRYYGIAALAMPDQPPTPDELPAYYAISATSLQGVYSPATAGTHWLSQYEAAARVGYSIFIYRLP